MYAAQAALLVPTEVHRRATMRTERTENANLAVAIAKCDEVLTQNTNAGGLAVGLAH